MALNLTLDASIPVLSEPGYWQFMSTRELADTGNPSDTTSHQGVWYDEPTKTIMLRPLQLESSFLNTPAQVDSIIGLSALTVNSADLSTGRIYEYPAFGNNDNPYIFHRSVGPSLAFPSAAPGAPLPEDGPSLIGVASPVSANITLVTATQGPTLVYQPSLTAVSGGGSPTITPIGNETAGKFIAETGVRMPTNQPLFFRWFQPNSQLGFPAIYQFYIGQFMLRVKDVTLEIFLDSSANGDRSSFRLIQRAPLWSVGDVSEPVPTLMSQPRPQDYLDHDRSLLWLPYRRNQVLLYSNEGKWAVIQVNARAKRAADGTDWDIVRSDSILVWVLTPAGGRFQIQKVKYPSGTIKVQAPPFKLDYTPTTAPAIILTDDTDHGTALSATRSQPPAYTFPVNIINACPPVTTVTGDPSRTYGLELSLTASGDQRWTPFFYGVQLTTARAYATSPTTPVTVSDTATATSFVQSASFTMGLKPGEGRMTVDVTDASPYTLGAYYYRCAIPVQLTDGGTTIFTGITEPSDVTPIKELTVPRHIQWKALDRWKQLKDTYLRDQRDWTNYGHIDVMKFTVEQAGVDTTSAEWPTGFVPAADPNLGTINTINSRLGGSDVTLSQQTRDIHSFWRPGKEETAADFVARIAELYSGWYVGFRLDGTFFYLPRYYFTTSSVTFVSQANNLSHPVYRNEVSFAVKEPEANVISVVAADPTSGTLRSSSLWVDWASIKNPAKVNYLGRWRAEIVQVRGAISCSQLNQTARTIWNQTRRRRVQVRFEADFVPSLKIGQVFTLGTYGNYRLIGANVRYEHQGAHFAQYEGEFVEAGY